MILWEVSPDWRCAWSDCLHGIFTDWKYAVCFVKSNPCNQGRLFFWTPEAVKVLLLGIKYIIKKEEWEREIVLSGRSFSTFWRTVLLPFQCWSSSHATNKQKACSKQSMSAACWLTHRPCRWRQYLPPKRSSALRVGRPLPPRKISGTHFC
jgi:hypothetical protein